MGEGWQQMNEWSGKIVDSKSGTYWASDSWSRARLITEWQWVSFSGIGGCIVSLEFDAISCSILRALCLGACSIRGMRFICCDCLSARPTFSLVVWWLSFNIYQRLGFEEHRGKAHACSLPHLVLRQGQCWHYWSSSALALVMLWANPQLFGFISQPHDNSFASKSSDFSPFRLQF